MEYLPLFRGGNPAGDAILEYQPPYTRITIRTTSRSGLWRAWLIGESGEIKIGTLEPRGHEFMITRKFSRQALTPAGCLSRVELRPASESSGDLNSKLYPGSESSGNLQSKLYPGLKSSGDLQSKLYSGMDSLENLENLKLSEKLSGTLERRWNGLRYLAFPYERDKPFPRPDLFCFARLDDINARKYWIFAFNSENWPIVPVKTPF